MGQGEHLDEVWRAALAASGDRHVAEAVTTAVLYAASPDATAADLVRQAVLAAVRQAPAAPFAAMGAAQREAVALARIAGSPGGEGARAERCLARKVPRRPGRRGPPPPRRRRRHRPAPAHGGPAREAAPPASER